MDPAPAAAGDAPELEDAAPEPLGESRFKQVKGISTKIPCDFYPDSYF